MHYVIKIIIINFHCLKLLNKVSYEHFVRPAFAYLLWCVVNYTLTGYGLSMAVLYITLEPRVIFPQGYPYTVLSLTYIFRFQIKRFTETLMFMSVVEIIIRCKMLRFISLTIMLYLIYHTGSRSECDRDNEHMDPPDGIPCSTCMHAVSCMITLCDTVW